MSGVDVCVVGSINQDVILPVPRTPVAGETVLGGDVVWAAGGKGANQAVGCARLGAATAMVGAVGDDVSGRALRQRLRDEHVDTAHVTTSTSPTGLAAVIVDAAGESTIVVSPGANGVVSVADVEAARSTIADARVVLCQLEIPLAVVDGAVALAGGMVVLNPAPGAALPEPLLERVDVLIPNRHELATIVGVAVPRTNDEVVAAAAQVRGPGAVVVTLGADGALVVRSGTATHVPAVPVEPVDATGAGDSFCAGLVTRLLAGDDVVTATRAAVRVAAVTTLTLGAMDAQPTWEQVAAALD